MELENLKVCTEMQNIAIRASERIEEEAKAYEARIKELEEKLEFSNWSAHDNICGLDEQIKQRDERIKELEFQNGILTDRLKFEKERKPKWISVKDMFPKTNKDVYCDDGRVHFHTSYGWSDQEQHFYWLDCELPTTEKSTAVEEN